ncbi:MAG: hypothetical protein ACI8UO_003358 [Verrucomicrobiales bacterium]
MPPEVWLDFAEAEKARDEKDVGFAAWLLGGIIALILLLVLWSPIGLFGGALPISIGAGAGAAALGWLFYRIVANANYRWRRSQRAVEIWIRPDGMRINRRIVYWNQSNAVLTAARVEKPVEATRYGILEVSVRVTGHHPSPITHHPSPITHHPSPITHHPSPITHHPSPITTHHPSPITHHPSPITHHPSPISIASPCRKTQPQQLPRRSPDSAQRDRRPNQVPNRQDRLHPSNPGPMATRERQGRKQNCCYQLDSDIDPTGTFRLRFAISENRSAF